MSQVETHDYQCPCELCEPEAHSVRELPDLETALPLHMYSGRLRGSQANVQDFNRNLEMALETLPAEFGTVARVHDAYFITPLQRAALDNGLAFDIVDKLHAWGKAGGLGAETLARLLTDIQTDQELERALAQSAAAREPERSKVWWHGVLPQ